MPTETDPTTTSRRHALRVGGLGALGAAFLAACGSDSYETKPGMAGAAQTTVTPTLPPREPNSAQLAAEQIELHTLASLEVLLAQVYLSHASKVLDDELRTASERYGADHQAAAAEIAGLTESNAADQANEEVRTRLVEPVEHSLELLTASDTDVARRAANNEVLELFASLESSLAATYVNSMTTLTVADLRQLFAGNGAAAARRLTVLDRHGEGSAPTSALFPAEDLIPGAAYLGPHEEEATDADAEAEAES